MTMVTAEDQENAAASWAGRVASARGATLTQAVSTAHAIDLGNATVSPAGVACYAMKVRENTRPDKFTTSYITRAAFSGIATINLTASIARRIVP